MRCRRVACPDCGQALYHDSGATRASASGHPLTERSFCGSADDAVRRRGGGATHVDNAGDAVTTPAERREPSALDLPAPPDEVAREIAKIRRRLEGGNHLSVVRDEEDPLA